jgi:pseudo-rSAM protein
MNKSYWFYIEPFVHMAVKGSKALLYNTLNGKGREYDNPVIVKLVRKLEAKKNLLVIKLTEKELQKPEISEFVKEVRKFYSGDLIDTSYSQKRPILLRPQVKIQKDVEEVKDAGESFVGEGIMDNLSEISLYLTNRCARNCSFCQDGYKQFLTCTKGSGKSGQELEIEKIRQFVEEAAGSSIFRFNILGGNIFSYPKFAEITHLLNKTAKVKTYHIHYLNLIDREDELALIRNDLSYLNVLVDFPISPEKFEKVSMLCSQSGINYEFVFVIQEEEEINIAQDINSRLKIGSVSFKPYYNKKNFDFFKENVFARKEELWLAKPGLKDIYPRMKVNVNHFGKITVLSSGAVHANVNRSKIGVLGRDSLYDVVLKEMYEGRSWRKPRSKVIPCKSCIYCFLCPPVSNYEYVLKRHNLCDIH